MASQVLLCAAIAVVGSEMVGAQMRGSATGLRYGMPDSKAMSYVSDCLRAAPRRPVELYSRGGWYVTGDLRETVREHAGNLEGLAMVWSIGDHPRAVYQWNHDLEFNRDVVACLDSTGSVTRSESKYTPADSEPKQRWVYIHTLTATGRHGNLQGSGRFTDAQGHPMGRPHLSSEDEDFIAGERVFHKWTDFDFAGLVDTAQR